MSALNLGTHEYLQSPLHVFAPRPRSMLLHVTTWSENVQDVITWTEDAFSLLVVTCPPTPQTCAVETHTSNVWGRDPNFKCMRRHQQLAALRSTLERLQLSSTFPIELTQPDSCGWRFVLRYLLVKLLSAASGARLTWWEIEHLCIGTFTTSGECASRGRWHQDLRVPDQYAGVQDPEIKLAHPPLPPALRALGTSSASSRQLLS